MASKHPLTTQFIHLHGRRVRIAIGGAPKATRSMLLFNGIGASIETMAPFIGCFERTRVVPLPADPKSKGPALFVATGEKK